MDRERITISIRKELLEKIDQEIDGVRMRNRSHAIELLVSESLDLCDISHAVIMAGGKGAIKLLPTIEKSIELLKSVGLKNIFIAVGFLGDKIKSQIGSGEKFGIKIEYIEGGEGTAGALAVIKKRIKGPLLVINSDTIMPIEIINFYKFHKQHQAIATIATKNQQTLKGYYILQPEIYNYIQDGFSMLEENVFPKVAKNSKLMFYPVFD